MSNQADTLIMVMAHSGAQHVMERHMPYWLAEKGDLIFTSPRDSMVISQWPVVALGYASHHNTSAISRFREILRFMSTMRYEWFRLHEYDSLCLRNISDLDAHTLYGNLFTSDEPKFKGHHFIHPPLTMSVGVLKRLVAGFDKVSDDCELCFWDRAAGLVSEQEGIKMSGYGAWGFSKNTIEPADIPAAIEARRNGAVMYHGVKSGAVLQAITSV